MKDLGRRLRLNRRLCGRNGSIAKTLARLCDLTLAARDCVPNAVDNRSADFSGLSADVAQYIAKNRADDSDKPAKNTLDPVDRSLPGTLHRLHRAVGIPAHNGQCNANDPDDKIPSNFYNSGDNKIRAGKRQLDRIAVFCPPPLQFGYLFGNGCGYPRPNLRRGLLQFLPNNLQVFPCRA